MTRMPRGLGSSGRTLWRSILDDVPEGLELTAGELHGLTTACRMVDRADELDRRVGDELIVDGSTGQPSVHPAVREARQHRASAAAIVQRIKLEPPAPSTRHLSRAQRNKLRDLNAKGYG